MVSEARDKILNLFQKDNAKLWFVCYPAARSPSTGASDSINNEARLKTKRGNSKLQAKAAAPKPYPKPPSAKQFQRDLVEDLDADKKGLFLQVIDHIKQGFLDMFSNGKGVLHNTTFWSQFFHSLVFELSADGTDGITATRRGVANNRALLAGHWYLYTKNFALLNKRFSFKLWNCLDSPVCSVHTFVQVSFLI